METIMKSLLGWFRFLFEFYVGRLCSLIGLHQLTTEGLSFPKSGGRLLVKGKYCPSHCVQNYFSDNNGTGPGFFIIATGAESSQFCVADWSHKNVHLQVEATRVVAHYMKCNSMQSLHTLFSLGFVICNMVVRRGPVLSPSFITCTLSLTEVVYGFICIRVEFLEGWWSGNAHVCSLRGSYRTASAADWYFKIPEFRRWI